MDEFFDDQFDRRHFLQAMALAGGTTAMLPRVGFGADHGSDPRFSYDSKEKLLNDFVKTEGDTSGEEVVLYGYGTLYTVFPDRLDVELFDTELFAVRRYQKIDGGWARLHREAGIYRDPETKEILTNWYNPFIERDVAVIDLFQEFNRKYLAEELGKTYDIGVMEHGGDVFFQRNFFLKRPSEMGPVEYPLHAQSDTYELSEYINLFTKRADLDNSDLTMAPAAGVTNSIGNWLPWMEMGTRPGHIVHQLRFKKLRNTTDMPEDFYAYIEQRYPKYLSAPEEWVEPDPNETSWAAYKEVIDKRRGGKTRPIR